MSIYDAYIVIGLPGVGKTFIQQSYFQRATRISSDDFIEKYAAEQGKTYDEVFKSYVKTANNLFFETLNKEVADNNPLLYIDRTNMSVNARNKIIKELDGYRI